MPLFLPCNDRKNRYKVDDVTFWNAIFCSFTVTHKSKSRLWNPETKLDKIDPQSMCHTTLTKHFHLVTLFDHAWNFTQYKTYTCMVPSSSQEIRACHHLSTSWLKVTQIVFWCLWTLIITIKNIFFSKNRFLIVYITNHKTGWYMGGQKFEK